MRLCIGFSLLFVLTAGASSVFAEDAVELTDSQKQLNEQGVQAILDGDPEKAIRVFKTALTLGDANVLHLNYGRALAAASRCAEARVAYEQVETAPKVALPSSAEVAKVLEAYRRDLNQSCPATVRLRCLPSTAQLSVDGGEPIPCPSEPLSLAPGTHVLAALLGDEQIAKTLQLGAGDSVELELFFEGAVEAVTAALLVRCADAQMTLSIDAAVPIPCSAQAIALSPGKHSVVAMLGEWREEKVVELTAQTPTELDFAVASVEPSSPSPEGSSWMSTTGWVLLGTGAALLTTSVIIDAAVLSEKVEALQGSGTFTDAADFESQRKDAQSLQTINMALLLGGSGLAAAGAVFLVVSLFDDEREATLLPVVGPGTLGLSVQF